MRIPAAKVLVTTSVSTGFKFFPLKVVVRMFQDISTWHLESMKKRALEAGEQDVLLL